VGELLRYANACRSNSEQLVERLTYSQLYAFTDAERKSRARGVSGPALIVDSYQDTAFYVFDYKSKPSTTGLRHKGYIKFFKPRARTAPTGENLECLVDCDCHDFKFRWAFADKQRGSSRVGVSSLNQAWNQAPRVTNPGLRPGLCVAKGELVNTARGYVPIEDVLVGDMVWTMSGWKPVTAAAQTGVRKTVTVTTVSGRCITVTPDHPVYVFNWTGCFYWAPAGTLTKDNYLVTATPVVAPRTSSLLTGPANRVDQVVFNEEAVPVYDLTVAVAEHFTVNDVVVHNCKHLAALADSIFGWMIEFDPKHPGGGENDINVGLDRLTRQAQRRWTDMPNALAQARHREELQRERTQARQRGQNDAVDQVQTRADAELPSPNSISTQPQTPDTNGEAP